MEETNEKKQLKRLSTLLISDFLLSNPDKLEEINATLINNGVNVSNDIKKIMLKHFICVDLEDEIINFMFYEYTCLRREPILEYFPNEGSRAYTNTIERLKGTNYLHFISNADFELIERAFFKDVAA